MASIIRQTTVIRDGFHNAFTDLQYWQGQYWISYRKGSGHLTMDGTACLSNSSDRVRFKEITTFKVPGDIRDPKLCVINDRKLTIHFTSWDGAYDGKYLKQYISFSEDGYNWAKPQQILTNGQWLWRIREHNGTFYGLIKHHDANNWDTIYLMTTTDFINWTLVSKIGTAKERLDESDIIFMDNGEAWVVARSCNKQGLAYFGSSKWPEFQDWQFKQLDNLMHAPIMLQHNGKVFLAGRYRAALNNYPAFPAENSLGIWEVNSGKAELVLHIPAIGDCSYAGLIKDPEGRICLTYYSYHAYMMGVLEPPIDKEGLHPNDVYFAELDL